MTSQVSPKASPRVSHKAAVLRLTLPPLAAVLLFLAATVWLILPATHEALLEQKRDTLRAIVASAISLCERHHAAELRGEIDTASARLRAAADLRALRYGEANKDYLWVIDHVPRMIAHPYRPDLEGQDLSTHRDPDGIALFSESVRMVSEKGEGFLHYRWQWQDDPARIVPKLSYVRDFAPWGWIIGSGVYLDDVEAGIARTTRQLLFASGGVALLLALLMALGLRQGLTSEAQRQSAAEELQRSNARYQALAQAAEEAVWLVSNERVSGANRSACRLFGYSENELLGREASSLFAANTSEPPAGLPHESMLATAAGAVPALVTVSSATVQGRATRVLTARDLRSGSLPDGDERRRREAAEALVRELQPPHLGWLQPAAPFAQEAPQLPLSSTRDDAMAALDRSPVDLLLLTAADHGVAGYVSAGDLLRPGANTAYATMHAPVRRLHAGASLATAADALAANAWRPLLLDEAAGTVLDAPRLLDALRHNSLNLAATIANAPQEALPDLRQRALLWLRSLISLQLNPERIAREATRLADAVLARCVALTLEETGPAPAPFEVIVVGSQGREEMMPGSDQDNALLYANGADPHWFRAFASQFVARYAAAGWPRCEGGTTAANPRWCLSLDEWRAQFSGWITGGSPHDLMEVATFFDFRALQPDAALSSELRAHALREAGQREVFLHQLAHDTLDFRAPLSAFGGIRGQDELDLKGCLVHFSAFARVEALRHGIAATGSGERLRALGAEGRISPELMADALSAWHFLLAQRLHLRAHPNHNDRLDPASLGAWELANLKRALAQISTLQAHLRHEQERHK